MTHRVIVSWSGGKDSAMALNEIMWDPKYKISALLTTVTQGYDRISMHGVRRILLEKQAESLGLALEKVFIPKDCSTNEYESKMRQTLGKYLHEGVRGVVFGDTFLEEVRNYREEKLDLIGMKGIFPRFARE